MAVELRMVLLVTWCEQRELVILDEAVNTSKQDTQAEPIIQADSHG